MLFKVYRQKLHSVSYILILKEVLILNDDMIITHLGDDYEKYFGAVIPPIFMNSLHIQKSIEELALLDRFSEDSFCYGRESNPTVRIAEKKIAALEHGSMALCFASGMAATTSAIMSVCNANDHIICIRNIYGPNRKFLENYCKPKFNISTTYVKGDDIGEIESAIRPNTKLIMFESPTTAVFSICDISAIAELAKSREIKTLIDNSYCTPLFQKPLDMGIDFVMHTATKYLGGHSDIIAGVLVSKDTKLMQRIACNERELYGGILGPMEGWLLIRGMRTLRVRLEAHQAAALQVAEFLETSSKIRKVNYPGLATHPQHDLIMKQQKGSSGLLSFELDGTFEQSLKLCNSLEVFKTGVSWGGFESLKSMPFYRSSDSEAAWLGCARGCIRLHVGLEGIDNQLGALDAALKKM